MQTSAVMQDLSGAWGDLLAWAVVVGGVLALARVIVRIDWSARALPPVNDIADVPDRTGRLDPEREWELVIRCATLGLARRLDLGALQTGAALKIDAAEHAYNRLVADCARIWRMPVASPVQPPHPLAIEPAKPSSAPKKAAERQPLAA